ncbi:MAG: Na+/H+ antiporter NhaA [Alistipes sp.]
MSAPWAGGLVLLISVVIAMVLANLPATAPYYQHLLNTDLALKISSPGGLIDWTFPKGMTVEKLINDGMMVIFFFTVGLEIKREVVCGQLSSLKRAILPVVAAVGGMVVPALIFTIFNYGTPAANGWGIPTATDIAFAVGILSMMGNRVPASLKIFLMALAISDDLGAIIVIALFYGGSIEWGCLMLALLVMAGVYLIKQMGETRVMYYLLPAFVVWGLFYYSGIHSTLSGVAMAMLIPMKPRYGKAYFYRKGRQYGDAIMATQDSEGFPNAQHRVYLNQMGDLSIRAVGLSYRLERLLNPYVTFLIMPIFALANAGVVIASPEYFNLFAVEPGMGAVGLGVFCGLVFGKPIGIFLTSWLAVKSGLATKPDKASWMMLFAVACLGGIGFTMSIFVDTLAYPAGSPLIDRGKIAILMGSTAAAMIGSILIVLLSLKKKKQ